MRAHNKTIKAVAVAIFPAVFLAAVTFLVFFTTLVIKDRTFYVFPDNIDQFFAWYQKLAYSLHSGILPIWDANVSAGHSFVGELQAGVFYPINLLWVWIFGSAHGISIFWLELIVVFHFWLASLGMYLAARVLGVRKIGALAAGLAYAFGGAVAVRSVSQTAIFFGLCYIPWVFFWFYKWLSSHQKRYLLLTSISLALIILAGHIDPWYFAILIILFSVIFKSPHPSFETYLKTASKRIGALAIAVIGSVVLALPQVILSAQYLPQAVRFVGDAAPIGPNQLVSAATFLKTYAFQPQDILSLLDPVKYPVADGNPLYVGLIGLAIILVTVLAFRKRLQKNQTWKLNRHFFYGATFVTAIIMLGYWTFVPAVLRYVPLFSQVRQLARYAIVIQFCLALLVGICIDVLSDIDFAKVFRGKKRLLLGLAGGTVVLGLLALNSAYYYLLSKRSAVVDKHFVYQNIIVVLALIGCFLLRKKVGYVLLGAMVLSSIVAPLWFMPKIAGSEATYPPNYYRLTPAISYLEQFYGKDRVLVENNALPVNIGDVYNIQTVNGYGATLWQPFYKYLNEPDAANQPGQHMNLLNVRFVVVQAGTAEPGLQQVLFDKVRDIVVYQRPDYSPRAYFADQLTVCNEHLPSCTPIDVTQYDDSDITLKYATPKAETLVLSELNYNGWKAFVDGSPVKIVGFSPTPTKLFRSIAVPAGSHTVTFHYEPFGVSF